MRCGAFNISSDFKNYHSYLKHGLPKKCIKHTITSFKTRFPFCLNSVSFSLQIYNDLALDLYLGWEMLLVMSINGACTSTYNQPGPVVRYSQICLGPVVVSTLEQVEF
jgi:hypothetical protein